MIRMICRNKVADFDKFRLGGTSTFAKATA